MSRQSVTVQALACAATLVVVVGCSRPAHVVWQQRYDSGQGDFGSSVAADGRDIIVGGIGRDTTAGTSGTAWELLRYDRAGKLLWHRVYNEGRRDSLVAVAVGTDHDIVGVGCSSPNAAGDSVRLLLAKFSPQGDKKWEKELALGLATRGAALKLDSLGRIAVCGSVKASGSATSDILVARFDPDGNLTARETLDFGADETGRDLMQVRVSSGWMMSTGRTLVVGERTPAPGRTDSLPLRDIVVAWLESDSEFGGRRTYSLSGDDRVAGWTPDADVGVTSRNDSGYATHLVGLDKPGKMEQDKRYKGAENARCVAVAAGRGGAVLGAGSSGPDGQQSALGWRYFRGKFSTFLPGSGYARGDNDRLNDVTLDSDSNVVATGTSVSGGRKGILTIKITLPRYKPPPNMPITTLR